MSCHALPVTSTTIRERFRASNKFKAISPHYWSFLIRSEIIKDMCHSQSR